MNAVHQEVDHQRVGVIRQKTVDVEQESMENILEDGPHKVAEQERWNSICEGLRSDATSLHCLDGCPGIDGERRKGVCAIRELGQRT